MLRIIFSTNIDLEANIDKTVRFSHNGLGVTIHQNASIGSYSQIEVNVVVGENQRSPGRAPQIGQHVHIGAGAVLIGDITIGDYSWIGANAVVTHDVEPYAVMVGVPAKLMKYVYPNE